MEVSTPTGEHLKVMQGNFSELKQIIEIKDNESTEDFLDRNSVDENKMLSKQHSVFDIKNAIDFLIYSQHLANVLYLTEQFENYKTTMTKQYEDVCAQIATLEKRFELKTPKKVFKKLIPSFVKPKIGVLYQHHPKKMKIPAKYRRYYPTRTPLISIVTPSFNQGDFIERTMASVLHQRYPALEYIIQDGGSTDDTFKIIQRYKDSLKHWESQRDNGQAHAINLGFQHAHGEIMGYLNSDDILLPGTLEYVAKYFEENPKVDVVYGHRILIDEFDHEIGRWVLPPHDNDVLSWADYIPQETLFWRRRIWKKIGERLDESFQFAMDWDMILRFRDAGAKFVRLPRFLGAFRVHVHQKTSAEMSKNGIKEIERLRTRCQDRKVSHYEVSANTRRYRLKHLIYHNLYKMGILRY